MDWPDLESRMLNTRLRSGPLSEPIVFATSTGSLEIRGIFSEESRRVLNGAEVVTDQPSCEVKASDLPAEPTERSEVVARGRAYSVATIERVDSDWLRIFLHRRI